jgi:hypothetical protein
MSERSYFSNRYLIPGSTLLLIIVLTNVFPLYKSLNQQQATTSLLGALVALLGSPALGFLLAQPWWTYFRRMKLWEMIPKKRLSERFGLKIDGLSKSEKEDILVVYDYILHSEVHSSDEKKGLSSYAFRRYDNYVLLSCTLFSLWLGLAIGALVRFFGIVSFKGIVFLQFDKVEPLVWWAIMIAVVVVSSFILEGLKWLEREYTRMHSAIISVSKIDKEDLKKVFKDSPSIFVEPQNEKRSCEYVA